MHGSDNPFMDMFASMDVVFILEVILSLMALIFAYDALAGEYERGTLRLVSDHIPLGVDIFLFCQIHRGNALPAGATADEFTALGDSAGDVYRYFLEYR